MLKEKKLIQGKRVKAVLTVNGLEEINIKEVTSVEELTALIEELNELRAMQQGIVKEQEKDERVGNEKTEVLEEEKEVIDETAIKRKQKEEEKNKKEQLEKENNEADEKNKMKEERKKEKREKEMSELLKELEELYPEKEVESAAFRQEHLKLYNKVSKLTKEQGVPLSEFLEGKGFKYLRKQRGVQKKEN